MSRADLLLILEAGLLLVLTLFLVLATGESGLWLVVPLLWLWGRGRSLEDHGLTWEGAGDLRLHLAVLGGIFVPYLIGHYLFGRFVLGMEFQLRWPEPFLGLVVEHVAAVGLPEEFFFRAYLQTQLDRVWGKPWQLLGARVGWGLPVASFLFAACHLTTGGIDRLSVFFPGLLYGWLWARTGTIVVPAAYHALSNILMAIMLSSLR